MIGLFGRKKTEAQPENVPKVSASSRLQELTGGDGELYAALANLMFLDPKRIAGPLENLLAEAREFEAKGNKIRAEVSYRIAGGLSLYRGDANGVRNYFTKAASFSGDSRPEYRTIAKKAEAAVGVARKYYEDSVTLKA